MRRGNRSHGWTLLAKRNLNPSLFNWDDPRIKPVEPHGTTMNHLTRWATFGFLLRPDGSFFNNKL